MKLLKVNETVITYKNCYGAAATLANKTGRWRYLTPFRREKTAPCTAACPLHSNTAEWIEKVRDKDYERAWEIIALQNPFPSITGHVCYHYCESDCNRSHYDEAIAIRDLERHVGLWRLKQFREKRNIKPPGRSSCRQKVAVVGSGPAGLSCAYYLTKLGFQVTVVERYTEPGGLLAWGIPEYRLPRHILKEEILILQAMGVEFKTGMQIDLSRSLDQLQESYAALFLAVGAGNEKKLDIPGENKKGVYGALSYLRAVHMKDVVPQAEEVVVIGGGNTAVDAALVSRLRGARVTIAYRRSRAEMPAHPEEISAAEEAGVRIVENVNAHEIVGDDHVTGLVLRKTNNKTVSLPCDLLLVAVGQEQNTICGGLSFPASDTFESNLPGVFAGGDVKTGPANVAAAIAAGREGAREIAHYLQVGQQNIDAQIGLPSNAPVIQYQDIHPDSFPKQRRMENPELEASRCFSCGHCNNCGICWMYCPDIAVAGPDCDLEILLDYCKGCGICVKECPGNVLEMEVGIGGTENNNR